MNSIARPSRADKAETIRKTIRVNWRTHSDREIAKMACATPTTIGKYRKELEDEGEILPRFENGHAVLPCLCEVSISAVWPAPENDKLYDPIRKDDPAFLALVENIRANGFLHEIEVSTDGYIGDGHRRYAAARYLGMERITVRIRPDQSRTKDPDKFVRWLKSVNTQRVKTTAEVLREGLVTMEPDTWHRVCDYRETVSEIDGAEVFKLVGEKKRSYIVQKRGLADAIVKVVNDYYDQDGPTSDRKVFYLLLNIPGLLRNDVTKTPFQNNDHSYQDVTDLLTRLRLDGSIPFDAIEDETRPVIIWKTHRSVGTFIEEQIEDFLGGYSRDLLQSQPNHIELLVEKNTVAAVLEDIASKYTIPMTSGRGYSSLPPRKGMVDRFRASGCEKLVVIVVSDFDPEGQDIPNAFGLSLRDDFGVEPDKLVIIKAALTHHQTQDMDIPDGRSGKEKGEGSRYKKFVDAYGEKFWELEAVPNDTLCEIVENTIKRTIDLKAFLREVEIERDEQVDLVESRRRVRDVLSGLDLAGGQPV